MQFPCPVSLYRITSLPKRAGTYPHRPQPGSVAVTQFGLTSLEASPNTTSCVGNRCS